MTPLPTPKFLAPLKRNIFPRDRDSDYRAISSDYLAAVTPLRAINQSWLQGNNPFQTPLCTGSALTFHWFSLGSILLECQPNQCPTCQAHKFIIWSEISPFHFYCAGAHRLHDALLFQCGNITFLGSHLLHVESTPVTPRKLRPSHGDEPHFSSLHLRYYRIHLG